MVVGGIGVDRRRLAGHAVRRPRDQELALHACAEVAAKRGRRQRWRARPRRVQRLVVWAVAPARPRGRELRMQDWSTGQTWCCARWLIKLSQIVRWDGVESGGSRGSRCRCTPMGLFTSTYAGDHTLDSPQAGRWGRIYELALERAPLEGAVAGKVEPRAAGRECGGQPSGEPGVLAQAGVGVAAGLARWRCRRRVAGRERDARLPGVGGVGRGGRRGAARETGDLRSRLSC